MNKIQGFAASLCAAGALFGGTAANAQTGDIKVGLMLPFSGTYAQLGEAVENGFKLYLQQQGGKFSGRGVSFVRVDDESEPSKSTDNVNKLIKRDKVDVIIGTVHSGVVMGMARAAKASKTLMIIPHAGTDEVTGSMCAPNIFRSSFSNWQVAYGSGKLAAQKGYKRVVTVAWRYTAGDESVRGFKAGAASSDTKVVADLTVPFPNVEFQALLTEIAALKPDAVYAFFGGAGSVKFIKDYVAAGLNKTIPLIGSGFLTEGVLQATGPVAEGLQTTLHYGDGLQNDVDRAFRAAYQQQYKSQPDVYAVQGYDAAQMLAAGLAAAKGDVTKQAVIIKAIETMTVDSPRGAFKLSKAHSPVQDIYTRTVKGGQNMVTAIAAKAVDSPSEGCAMVK